MKNTMQKTPTQTTKILLYLKEGNKITGMGALKLFNCWRLSGRILEIRKMGFKIKTDYITTPSNKVIAEYKLMKGCYQTNLF